jgi:hypothetical protein
MLLLFEVWGVGQVGGVRSHTDVESVDARERTTAAAAQEHAGERARDSPAHRELKLGTGK